MTYQLNYSLPNLTFVCVCVVQLANTYPCLRTEVLCVISFFNHFLSECVNSCTEFIFFSRHIKQQVLSIIKIFVRIPWFDCKLTLSTTNNNNTI